jgi:hypothetical protein
MAGMDQGRAVEYDIYDVFFREWSVGFYGVLYTCGSKETNPIFSSYL